MRRILLLLAVVAAIAVVLASPAWAKNYSVDRNDDPDFTTTPTADDCTAAANDCSLRGAIKAAEATTGADKITFNLPSPATITLLRPDLTVSDPKGLTIDGSSANITISGINQVRVFSVTGKLTLSNLAVTNGFSPTLGGAILNTGGTVTVRDSTLSNNSTEQEGGAIFNSGRLTVGNSTLSNNAATFFGGAIDNHGSLEVSNSTLSENRAFPRTGGGILNRPAATTTLKSTIVANSGDGGDCVDESLLLTGITDGGYNLSEDFSCLRGGTASFGGADPLLADLAPNGGPTMTHALQPDSPAIDGGKSFGAGADQRGEQRPVDLLNIANAPRGDGSDIGAYEVQQP